MNSRLTVTLAVSLGLMLSVAFFATASCTRGEDTRAGDATTTAAELPARSAEPLPRSIFAPPALRAVPEQQPTLREEPRPPTTGTPPPVTTVPSWVPDSGRYSIIEAGDLGRNLGLIDAAAPAADAAP